MWQSVSRTAGLHRPFASDRWCESLEELHPVGHIGELVLTLLAFDCEETAELPDLQRCGEGHPVDVASPNRDLLQAAAQARGTGIAGVDVLHQPGERCEVGEWVVA